MQEENELTDNDLPENFHGVWIDVFVWKDKELTWLEKCVVSEIHWLSKEAIGRGKRGCWASNKHLADMFGVHINSISRIIKKLIELQYLTLVSFNGRYRILKSNLITSKDIKDGKH